MHKAPGACRVTVTLMPDAVRQLEEWAANNVSSLSAKAVRERAAREAHEKASA